MSLSSQLLVCLLCVTLTFKTVRESVLSGTVFVEKRGEFFGDGSVVKHQKAHGGKIVV